MKVQLLINGRPSNGYMNIDVLANPQDQDRISGDIVNLDSLVDNNECEQLLAINVIDFIPLQIRQQVLTNWMGKIAHGGLLILSAMDLKEVARVIDNGQLSDVVGINQTVFGLGTNLWTIRKSYVSAEQTMQMILSTEQFYIESIKYEGLYYYITAKRK